MFVPGPRTPGFARTALNRGQFTLAPFRWRRSPRLTDVTASGVQDRELLKRFQLFGPPGTIFFDAPGREVPGTRVVGFQNIARFIQIFQAAGL